jgi:hypothetical protein
MQLSVVRSSVMIKEHVVKKSWLTRPGAIVAFIAAIAAAASTVALATGGSSANVYQACLSHDGTLYNVEVNPSSPPTCRHGDTPISWNQSGPAGATGATGPQGPQGASGDTGPEGPQGAKGDTGPQGIQGVMGTTGATGDAGPQGPTGPTGPSGQNGSDAAGAFAGGTENGGLSSGAQYLAASGLSTPTGDGTTVFELSPNAPMVARDLAVSVPGGVSGGTRTFTVDVSGNATTVSCTIPAGSFHCDSGDVTANIPAGSLISIGSSVTGSPNPTAMFFGWRATTQ